MEDNTQIKEAGNLKPNKFKVPIIIGLFLAAAIASFFLFSQEDTKEYTARSSKTVDKLASNNAYLSDLLKKSINQPDKEAIQQMKQELTSLKIDFGKNKAPRKFQDQHAILLKLLESQELIFNDIYAILADPFNKDVKQTLVGIQVNSKKAKELSAEYEKVSDQKLNAQDIDSLGEYALSYVKKKKDQEALEIAPKILNLSIEKNQALDDLKNAENELRLLNIAYNNQSNSTAFTIVGKIREDRGDYLILEDAAVIPQNYNAYIAPNSAGNFYFIQVSQPNRSLIQHFGMGVYMYNASMSPTNHYYWGKDIDNVYGPRISAASIDQKQKDINAKRNRLQELEMGIKQLEERKGVLSLI